jgi:hypothetical protein
MVYVVDMLVINEIVYLLSSVEKCNSGAVTCI